MVVAMRTTWRTIRLVLHQSTFPVWVPWDSYLRLSYLYFRCYTRLCDVLTTFVVNTVMMVFNLWLMCVIDIWAHISLCIQFLPWNWVWQKDAIVVLFCSPVVSVEFEVLVNNWCVRWICLCICMIRIFVMTAGSLWIFLQTSVTLSLIIEYLVGLVYSAVAVLFF